MDNQIKIYEKLSILELKSGRILQTTMSIEQIAEILNKSDFVVIDWRWFNKFEVKEFFEYKPTDVDCFILSQPIEIREKLQQELKKRKSENKKTNMEIILNIMDRLDQ